VRPDAFVVIQGSALIVQGRDKLCGAQRRRRRRPKMPSVVIIEAPRPEPGKAHCEQSLMAAEWQASANACEHSSWERLLFHVPTALVLRLRDEATHEGRSRRGPSRPVCPGHAFACRSATQGPDGNEWVTDVSPEGPYSPLKYFRGRPASKGRSGRLV